MKSERERKTSLKLPSGVLGWNAIRARWKEKDSRPSDLDAVVVTPLDPEGFDVDALDLRLGPRFVLSRPHSVGWEDFSGKRRKRDRLDALRSQELIHIPRGEHIVIPPHGTVLGVTLEFIKLPYNVSGEVLTKSSLARRFVTIETAPWIHPLYRGCLTLEIANASSVAVRLKVGEPIAQLVLFSVSGVERPTRGRDRIDRYAGPTYPELDPMSEH